MANCLEDQKNGKVYPFFSAAVLNAGIDHISRVFRSVIWKNEDVPGQLTPHWVDEVREGHEDTILSTAAPIPHDDAATSSGGRITRGLHLPTAVGSRCDPTDGWLCRAGTWLADSRWLVPHPWAVPAFRPPAGGPFGPIHKVSKLVRVQLQCWFF